MNIEKRIRITGLVLMLAASSTAAPVFKTLIKFDGSNGSLPLGALVQGLDGSFYGSTRGGGSSGGGTIFKLSPAGVLTTIYSFPNNGSGGGPSAALVQTLAGNFYGTTPGNTSNYYGTIFEVTPGGKYSLLHTFDLADGPFPFGPLIQAANGQLYGTTAGILDSSYYGTVFEISLQGNFVNLHNFNYTDGFEPGGALVEAADGYLYGTAPYGGLNGEGVIFRITQGGVFTDVYSFCSETNCRDGAVPIGALVETPAGDLFGVTDAGGSANVSDNGTVFKYTPGGTLATLYSFCVTWPSCPDGYDPTGLTRGSDGNFYGTTVYGGASNRGTIFRITPGGKLTTLHSFCAERSCSDVYIPYGTLLQATDGKFYGVTGSGSRERDNGTIFSLDVGLGPFVTALPASGAAGKQIGILGTNLTGASNVTFNGTAAVFTVASPSLILTNVPVGASSGDIQVTLPSGFLVSNARFVVH